MDGSQNDLSARTDDVARRIEYVTGGKWTGEQYKKVCAMLRYYRHKSLSDIIDRISREAKGTKGPEPKGGGA